MSNREARRSLLADRPLAVDLFSGVGGLALGLELAGFASLAHVEVEEQTARYARFNFPLSHHLVGGIEGDVRHLSGSTLQKLADGREIALIAGGPPCQGFSRAGLRRVDDPLNDLVLEMARVILETEPRSFLIENVPGIQAGQYWQFDKALEMLSEMYAVSTPTVLKAEHYGVPQTRRRVFTVGIRRDLGIVPRLPAPSHYFPDENALALGDRTPTVADALLDIPNCDDYEHLLNSDTVPYQQEPHSAYASLMRESSGLAMRRGYAVDWDETICTNLRRTSHGPDLTEKLQRLEPGAVEKSSRIPRLRLERLGLTIRAGTTSERGSWSAPRPCHPIHPRVLSTRECARIQSFPDWFRFHPVKWHGNRQVGNAVPPLLGMAVGSSILKSLGEVLPTRTSIFHVHREVTLIAEDLDAAERANYAARKTSHKVTNTDRSARRRG